MLLGAWVVKHRSIFHLPPTNYSLRKLVFTFSVWFLFNSGCCSGLIPIQCYSCMSKNVEMHWKGLKYLYIRPENFTNDCNRPVYEKGLRTRACHTVCLAIREKVFVSRHHVDTYYYRGCMAGIARWGIDSKTARRLETFANKCINIRQDQFYRQQSREDVRMDSTEPKMYEVCSCYGDRCNGIQTVNSYRSKSRFSALVVPALWATFATIISSR